MTNKNSDNKLNFFKLQSKFFPSINEASIEIINLSAILELPKGTEHFLSDIHGEDEAFSHVIKNASGAIKNKIEEIFGKSLMNTEKRSLATLIYYPEEMMEKKISEGAGLSEWYRITLYRLVEICRESSSGYTRSKVRKALPKTFSYIIEELLNERYKDKNRETYFESIIKTIIDTGKAEEFIVTLAKLIQRFVIDTLHIIGDIYDRGHGAEKIFDILLNYHSVDVQWGNHDIVWMGAASGSEACIANVMRVSLKYGNLHTIEEGYGINILPLASFAMDVYKNDECGRFHPTVSFENDYSEKDIRFISQMHKAIAIIQFKLEGQLIKKYKDFKMENRLILDKIDVENSTVIIDGKTYSLLDNNFPTIDLNNPYELTREEKDVIKKLKFSFINNEKLQKHVSFLFSNGSIFLKLNGNLLYHGCIPTNEDGEFSSVSINGVNYKGKALIEMLEVHVREGYFNKEGSKEKEFGEIIMWYLWSGSNSPLFGKSKMSTFESYFIEDKEACKEEKDYYYKFRYDVPYVEKILREFELDPENSHIINGHIPVKNPEGENPVKANGKLFVIDGGLSKVYQETTGIAGYTLIYSSKGLILTAHQPFHSKAKAIEEESDILSTEIIIEKKERKLLINDTDTGAEIREQIENLKELVEAYKKGIIKEKR